MVTTAGGTGLLTGWDVFSTDGPLGRSPRSPSTPLHPNVLQTGPLAGAQLEGNDIFGVDVYRRAGGGVVWVGRKERLDWKWNIKHGQHILKSINYFVLMLVICLVTLFRLIRANSYASSWILLFLCHRPGWCPPNIREMTSYHRVFIRTAKYILCPCNWFITSYSNNSRVGALACLCANVAVISQCGLFSVITIFYIVYYQKKYLNSNLHLEILLFLEVLGRN